MDLNKKFKLLALIDDQSYTLSEIYQQQLFRSLFILVDLTLVSLEEIFKQSGPDPKLFDGVFCSIRYRNTLKHSDHIQAYLDGCPVIINDFDPWVNFIDGSPYKNTYQIVNSKLNVQNFFVSADYWAKRLQEQGLNAKALEIGMEPTLIKNTKNFLDKNRCIEFRGSKHPLRVMGHQKLKEAGLNVPWLENVRPYSTFLESVNDLQIWCHNESVPIKVDGEECCFNALWPKAIEVLSRGCFVIRDYQEEAVWYSMEKIPTVFMFDDVKNAKDQFEKIMSLPEKRRNEMIEFTIDFLRKKNYWDNFVSEIINEFS